MIKTAQQKRNAKGLLVGTMQSATTVLLDGSTVNVTVKPTYSGAANGDRVAVQQIRGRQYIAFLLSPPQAPLVLETEWFNLNEKAQDGTANPTMSTYTAYDDAYNYAPARFRRDAFGVVQLSGLIRPISGTQPTLPYTLFTLPVGFRPAYNLLFQTTCNGAAAAIEVSSAGLVIVSSILGTGADSGFLSLDGVNFVTEDLVGFTPVFHYISTFTNSWVNFGTGGFAPARYWVDPDGFVHLSGIIKSGTTSGPAFTLPSPYFPDFQEIFCTCAASGTARIDIATTGGVTVSSYTTGGSNADVSLDGIICGTGTNQWPKWHTQNPEIPFLASWAYYGTPFANARYCVDRAGNVHWSGLVKLGSSSVSLFTSPLPAAIFPQFHLILDGIANGGLIRLDIWWNPATNANNINMVGYYQGGTNAFVSLSNIYYSLK